MKLGLVTNYGKRKTMASKNGDVVSANYEVIYQSFGAIQNSDFRCLVYDSYI